jgi:hypothetical protein
MGEMDDVRKEQAPSEKRGMERLLRWIDSWQKLAIALSALVIALGGLAGAGVKAWQTLNAPDSTAEAAPDRSATSQKGVAGMPTPTASSRLTSAPVRLVQAATEVDLPDGNSLEYDTASGPQPLLDYFSILNEINAGAGVNLVALDPPAPTADTAYATCRRHGDYTSEISLNKLAPGSSVCAFTPNKQVVWIRFLHPDANSQSAALRLNVTTWQGS